MLIDGEYCVRMVCFPGDIKGAVRLSEDGFANIYINDQLAPEEKKKAFAHEVRHIELDDFYNGKPIEEVECQDQRSRN